MREVLTISVTTETAIVSGQKGTALELGSHCGEYCARRRPRQRES
jgi:hypothetical protein